MPCWTFSWSTCGSGTSWPENYNSLALLTLHHSVPSVRTGGRSLSPWRICWKMIRLLRGRKNIKWGSLNSLLMYRWFNRSRKVLTHSWMSSSNEIKVDMYKHWVEDLRQLSLVGGGTVLTELTQPAHVYSMLSLPTPSHTVTLYTLMSHTPTPSHTVTLYTLMSHTPPHINLGTLSHSTLWCHIQSTPSLITTRHTGTPYS